MKIISTPSIAEPQGHYSPVIEHQGILYLSGQLPIDPVSKQIPDSIDDQTRLVLSNIDLLLSESGSSKNHVLQMRVYLSDITLWNKVNEIYSHFFGDHKPARCVVPTRELHFGCLIEIEVIAMVRDDLDLKAD